MRHAWLLVLAACGGSSPRAPSGPPTTTASLIELLEADADRACACTDRGCAAAVAADVDAQLAAPLPALVDDPQFARADAAIQRGVTCLWAHEIPAFGYSQLGTRALADQRDEICACDEVACVTEISARTNAHVRHLQATPAPLDREQGWDDVSGATDVCVEALVDRDPVILELDAVRAQACACKPADRACGDVANAGFRDWVARNGQTTTRFGWRARELTVELVACLAATGAQVGP